MPQWRKLHTKITESLDVPPGYVPRQSWHHLRRKTAEPTTAWIYGLVEPGTDMIRYIGKTHTDLGQRLALHLTAARKNKPTQKDAWIRSLLEVGTRPEIVELGAVPYELWPLAEQAALRWAKAQGFRLLNTAGAGGGA